MDELLREEEKYGELLTSYKADNYPGIGPALVLVFSTPPFRRPIRPHRWPEYEAILNEWRKKGNAQSSVDCITA